MKILSYVHLRNIYGPTGAGRLARYMVEGLHNLGQDRVVVLADPADHRNIIPKVRAPWDGYEYRFLGRDTSRQQLLWVLTEWPSAETFWPEAQIVYCAGESYVPVRRARLVVTVHDAAFFEPDAHARTWAARKQEMKWRFLYHKLSRGADRLLTVSQFSADRLSYFFPSLKDRLRVVPSAVPNRFFAPVSADGEKAMADIGLAGRRFILLPRGLWFRKNADLVLAAWPKLLSLYPDLVLVITGHCDTTYAKRAAELGPSVRLTGFIDDELLCSLYSRAQIVWFPSLYEGFGLPPLEAMACGTPVVASNCSSVPEITAGAAVLVSPTSIDQHIGALDWLLRDFTAVENLVIAGRLRAQVFTWKAAVQKLRLQLQELA
jgi:glycosyltransferase involved in cell wall biosynthesis